MSTLIDRLVGYGIDDDAKLPIHQYVDALYLRESAFTGKPTDAEIIDAFSLTAAETTDTLTLLGIVSGGSRTVRDIEAVLRLAERFPGAITKSRVIAMLGL